MCNGAANWQHIKCDIKEILHKYAGGVPLAEHQRSYPPRPSILSARLPESVIKLAEIVNHHPDTTPIQLLHGIPTLHRITTPAGEIDPAFQNRGCLQYWVMNIKASGVGYRKGNIDNTLLELVEFMEKHNDFVVNVSYKPLVVTVRTNFMQDLSVQDVPDSNETLINTIGIEGAGEGVGGKPASVRGHQSDGAHKFFKDDNEILMTTSTYESLSKRWFPVLFSWMRGATAKHYKTHFAVFFEGIRKSLMASRPTDFNLTTLHHLFLHVVDFSHAQRNGFIQAYAELCHRYCQELSNACDEQQILDDGASLLKGCQQHFAAAVKRVANNGGLASIEDVGKSDHLRVKLTKKWPKAAVFFAFWATGPAAKMLSAVHSSMPKEVRDTLPNTTNAQEALHWLFYRAVELGHSLLSGLAALYRVVMKFQQDHATCKAGDQTDYSQRKKANEEHQDCLTKREKVAKEMGTSHTTARDKVKKADMKIMEGEVTLRKMHKDQLTVKGKATEEVEAVSALVENKQMSHAIPTKELWQVMENVDTQGKRKPKATVKSKTPLALSADNIIPVVPEYREGRHTEKPKKKKPRPRARVLEVVNPDETTDSEFNGEDHDAAVDDTQEVDKRHHLVSRGTEALHVERSHVISKHAFSEAGCSIDASSCWLDTTLQLVTASLQELQDVIGLRAVIEELPTPADTDEDGSSLTNGAVLCKTFEGFLQQLDDDDIDEHLSVLVLNSQRNALQKMSDVNPFFTAEYSADDEVQVIGECKPPYLGPRHPEPCDLPMFLKRTCPNVTYHLVGVAFMSTSGPKHFTARYWNASFKKVLHYDDQKEGGRAKKLQESSRRWLGNSQRYPAYTRPHQAYYVLDNGFDAQRRYTDNMHKTLKTKYNLDISIVCDSGAVSVQYSEKNFVALPFHKQPWMDNTNRTMTEYVTRAERDKQRTPPPVESQSEAEQTKIQLEAQEDFPEADDEQEDSDDEKTREDAEEDKKDEGDDKHEDGDVDEGDDTDAKGGVIDRGEGDVNSEKGDLMGGGFLLLAMDQQVLKKVWLVNKPLRQRLRPGIAVIVSRGSFCYPARLIKKCEGSQWLVHWSEDNIFTSSDSKLARTISLVDKVDIGDHFWMDHESRCKTRLGLWKLASFSGDWVTRRLQERLLHTPEFNEALDPHIVELRKLILWPQDYNQKLVPCKAANLGVMRPNQTPLTLTEHAMLNNWLHDKLCRHPTLYLETFCDAGAVHVHVIMLLVAYQLKRDRAPGLDTSDEIAVRRHAWEIQRNSEDKSAGHEHLLNDITRRAVADLEALMFDERSRAGRAGVRQWGLDAGYHQNNWSPYKDFVGERDPVCVAEKWEDEIQQEWNEQGLNYIAWEEPETLQKPHDRPKPCQIIPGQETPSHQDSAAKYKQKLFKEFWEMDVAFGNVEMVGSTAGSTAGDDPPADLVPTPWDQLDEDLSELTKWSSDRSEVTPQPVRLEEPIVEVRHSARVKGGQAKQVDIVTTYWRDGVRSRGRGRGQGRQKDT
ncbi:hypothetical protein NP233_g12468 [Leucocoprinus birnbaumii]|uniref:Uncharacterized protein n=1 Tax=Leucocoprinus birnbaumii TaxID=56174 RepID=A0AAD5VED5_9AGAR|nr:hypothetical protein NP233_g12468 [Leucocoprinus birnbaumii]